MTTKTDKLLDELNALRGLQYPDIGFSYFADITGDGTNRRRVYEIINKSGGVRFSELNAATPRKRCDKIRAAIEKVQNHDQRINTD